MDHGSAGIHDVDFQRFTLQTIASEVERVDVNRPVSSLHHPGDELVGVQSVVLAGEDLFDRAAVTARKPGHPFRMDVDFPDPANARQALRSAS